MTSDLTILQTTESQEQPTIDPLTGALNRYGCTQLVNQYLREGTLGAFGLMNYRGLKKLILQYGNTIVDKLHCSIVQALRELFPTGHIARLVGDEYVIIQPTAGMVISEDVLDKQHHIFHRLRHFDIPELKDIRHAFTFSLIAIHEGNYAHYDDLYNKALELLDNARKHEGSYLVSEGGEIPDVEGLYLSMMEDRDSFHKHEDKIFHAATADEWLIKQQENAEMKEQMCQRNKERIRLLNLYFNQPHLPAKEYERLFDLIARFRRMLDPFHAEEIIKNILLPYYESLSLDNHVIRGHLVKLHLHLADSLYAISNMGEPGLMDEAWFHIRRSIQLGKELPVDDIMFPNYLVGICHVLGHFEFIGDNPFTPEQRDVYYLELYQHLHAQLVDKNLARHFYYLTFAAKIYPIIRCLHLMNQPKRTQAQQQELEEKRIYISQHLVNGCLDSCPPYGPCQELSRLMVQVVLKTSSAEDLLSLGLQQLESIQQSARNAARAEHFCVLSYVLFCITYILNIGKFTDEYKSELTLRGWNTLNAMIKYRQHDATDQQCNSIAVEILKHAMSMPILSFIQKYDKLIETLSVMSMDTYVHCRSVTSYADVILRCVIHNRPELLVGATHNLCDVQTVRDREDSICHAMHYNCMTHDIGKLNQVSIINNSYRPLTNHEFELLKKHPELGVQLLKAESHASELSASILGHHKWYNGEGGYPESYDNTEMPQQVLIDIITICDSLDAATSRMGRNYRNAKKFSDVVDELIVQGGTRYNLQVVQAILMDRDCYMRLRQMIEVGWQDLYRQIYQDVVR